MRIGTGELIVLAIVLAIVFSASRMAALGNALGKFVDSFKKASGGKGFVDAKPTRVIQGEAKEVRKEPSSVAQPKRPT